MGPSFFFLGGGDSRVSDPKYPFYHTLDVKLASLKAMTVQTNPLTNREGSALQKGGEGCHFKFSFILRL